MPDIETRSDVTALTVQLLSAYLSNNTVASDDLAGLILTTRSALTEDLKPADAEAPQQSYSPAVTPRKSLASPEHIISLIDGKPYKTLKRHLARHGLTPDSYRERYNLPGTYPMVAPSFAAKRREIAKKIGLGARRSSIVEEGRGQAELAAEVTHETVPAKTPAERAAAKTAKPKAASTARRRRSASVDKAIPAINSAPRAKNDEPVTANAKTAPKKGAAHPGKAPKPAAKGKPRTSPDANVSVGVEAEPSGKAKPKRAAAVTRIKPATSAAAGPVRTKATNAIDTRAIEESPAEVQPAPAAKARPARGTKLSLFRSKAGETAGGDAAITDAVPAAQSEASPAPKAAKVKRMARMPVVSSPQ